MRVNVMKVPVGWIGACFSKKGLALLTLPHKKIQSVMEECWENFNELMLCGTTFTSREQAENEKGYGAELYLSLFAYFENGDADFTIPLDWSVTSQFAKEVYKKVSTIPPGEVRTYGWVAEKIGKPGATRAVGQVLRRNPYPIIIPCHRVVAANGLGGYVGGVELKKKLLGIEGYKLSERETG